LVRAAHARSFCLSGLAAAVAACTLLAPQAAQARFDTNAAWKLIRTQLAYGQRPAGSPQLQALARRLRPLLPHGRFESLPGQPGLRNIVGTLPGRRPAVVIGAHYDTLADPHGFVGANNGAAGTAVVVEAARALAAMKPRRGASEIHFVLFDGEEPPSGLPEDSPDFYSSGLRGSRAYVAAHRGQTAEMVLLDYVGNKGLSIPREGTSTPWLWASLRRAAASVGAAAAFPRATGPGFLDDHTPFLRAGLPAIDLIDPAYDGHSVSDRLDKLSRRSVAQVGATLVALAQKLR
jgi:hypothetical protein